MFCLESQFILGPKLTNPLRLKSIIPYKRIPICKIIIFSTTSETNVTGWMDNAIGGNDFRQVLDIKPLNKSSIKDSFINYPP